MIFNKKTVSRRFKIQLMELRKWNGVAQKQKRWKIVEKQGKFLVTLTGFVIFTVTTFIVISKNIFIYLFCLEMSVVSLYFL